jgi:anti-sigma regulatory factor (Ser/Thr protein kinase)
MTTCVMTFPGRPEAAAAARRWAAGCLPGCPAADDAVLALSELVTNSVRHSRSGLLPGGRIRVRISIAAGAWVRIEVRDDGPASWSAARLRDGTGPAAEAAAAVTKPSVLAEDGRGLWLVSTLSGGQARADGRGVHWVRLPWSPAPAPVADDPEPWAVRWLAVMERARWRCECAGQCGRDSHKCPAEPAPGYLLHVVPAIPAGEAAAAALPAECLVALCGPCRAGADRAARKAAAAAPQPGALFSAGGDAGW